MQKHCCLIVASIWKHSDIYALRLSVSKILLKYCPTICMGYSCQFSLSFIVLVEGCIFFVISIGVSEGGDNTDDSFACSICSRALFLREL